MEYRGHYAKPPPRGVAIRVVDPSSIRSIPATSLMGHPPHVTLLLYIVLFTLKSFADLQPTQYTPCYGKSAIGGVCDVNADCEHKLKSHHGGVLRRENLLL
ncbi:hypothetical protein NECAME_18609 [Necator americanus]|uniref:Uncharacterized protein n=1 Tax=Necator americanus TaxID=51031 RepID=W2ST49_NECAM|nr:hypothetical protein NECAME_18609 [Necator americanus]ETN72929.1 hypothetical protein NECAME_18609 [Necator americanus]